MLCGSFFHKTSQLLKTSLLTPPDKPIKLAFTQHVTFISKLLKLQTKGKFQTLMFTKFLPFWLIWHQALPIFLWQLLIPVLKCVNFNKSYLITYTFMTFPGPNSINAK